MVLIKRSTISILTQVMGVIESLKQPMVLNRPCHLGSDVGSNHGGSELRVIERCEVITQIVDQRRDHPLDVRAIILGSTSGL